MARKMYSMYFPMIWSEGLVNPANVLMMNGEFNSANDANYINKDEEIPMISGTLNVDDINENS